MLRTQIAKRNPLPILLLSLSCHSLSLLFIWIKAKLHWKVETLFFFFSLEAWRCSNLVMSADLLPRHRCRQPSRLPRGSALPLRVRPTAPTGRDETDIDLTASPARELLRARYGEDFEQTEKFATDLFKKIDTNR